MTVNSCVSYAPPLEVGSTENVIVTSSVAKAFNGSEIVTSIVPVFSLLNLDWVEMVEDYSETDNPVGGEEAEILNVSGPFPWFVTVRVVVES